MKVKIILRNEEGTQFFTYEIITSATLQTPESPLTASPSTVPLFQLPSAWTPLVLRLQPSPPLQIFKFGRYFLNQVLLDGHEEVIGEFVCVQLDPVPLTPDRVTAIKSDPYAAKSVHMTMGCNECNDSLKTYAALERSDRLEKEYTWYSDLHDQFTCNCTKFSVDLRTIRKNLYGLLGAIRPEKDETINFIPLYERATLQNIRIEFSNLLRSKSREEVVQKFLQDNPILLRQFPAERILFKPPILTRFVADFAILTPQKELILIEIERMDTTLLRKNGDHAAPLTHAVNQVQNWLQVIDDHRMAAITEMKLDPTAIGNVRGVVVAGRDGGYDPAHLRQLKAMINGRISFFTYDDLLGSLTALVGQIGQL